MAKSGGCGAPQARTLTTPIGLPSADHNGRGKDQTWAQVLTHQGQEVTWNLNPGTFPPASLCSTISSLALARGILGSPQTLLSNSSSLTYGPSSQAALCRPFVGAGGPLRPVVPSTHSRGPGTGHTCSVL